MRSIIANNKSAFLIRTYKTKQNKVKHRGAVHLAKSPKSQHKYIVSIAIIDRREVGIRMSWVEKTRKIN